jgi:hypothetical protein
LQIVSVFSFLFQPPLLRSSFLIFKK